MTDILVVGLSAAGGAVAASFLACVPGLHVYNVMGVLALILHTCRVEAIPEVVAPALIGMTVGFALLNTIPSVLLAAPDESALLTVLPGQKYLMAGRGYEGSLLTALGGLVGLWLLVLVIGPLAAWILPAAHKVLRSHTHWILWCVIVFLLMSEWPKGGRFGQGGLDKLLDAWKSLGVGLLTFVLSGFLGFVLLYRSPIRVSVAFQNIMPAFVGLFAMPWLILNIASATAPPPQRKGAAGFSVDAGTVFRGALAGGLGGGFAAFFPVVTGGVGGFLAGHATATRDDRVFLISQGASKLIYYVGGLLLFFVPGLWICRGGAARMLQGFHVPRLWRDFHMAMGAVAIAGSVALTLFGPLTRGTIWVMERTGYRRVSAVSAAVALALVLGVTGWAGLAVTLVGTGIGLLPLLYGSRRINCLGVILLPMACNMSGVGGRVAEWLGLF